MKTTRIVILLLLTHLFIFSSISFADTSAVENVSPRARCSVCGMFVAKYPNWLTQVHFENSEQVKFFDGVKDLMVFYFDPEKYNGPGAASIKNIFVKDYYSLKWLPAKEAYYVAGSDVYGPMGHELIPFESKGAAESFLKDHHGNKILTFSDITPELIQSLRLNQKMR